eukprot:275862-Amphidinium_carterae.1
MANERYEFSCGLGMESGEVLASQDGSERAAERNPFSKATVGLPWRTIPSIHYAHVAAPPLHGKALAWPTFFDNGAVLLLEKEH